MLAVKIMIKPPKEVGVRQAISTLLLLLLSSASMAATVAIIDSGTDMKHPDIAPYAWTNPNEIPGNNRDEDSNGYQDDIFGWNFAEGNNQVIDYSYLGTLTEDIRRFFDIQTLIFLGTATDEDMAWIRAKVQEEEFIKQITIYGNFMHGTHVGGIAIKDSPNAKLMAVKLIPTEVKLPFSIKPQKGRLGMTLLKRTLSTLAQQQMVQMTEIATYVGDHKADIANGSFGTGFNQAKVIVGTLGRIVRNITEEQIEEATKHFLDELIREGKKMADAAPDTLFVFAAGNDGSNNDIYPTSPTNIRADNVVSVAATLDRKTIANFSNYGEKMVDVAAPGVSIRSTAPGGNYISVSGTSQAAPFVANVASIIKDANPSLKPKEVKEILMKTVDLKDFLKGKVVSNGIVNENRALRAAQLSTTSTVAQAIARSQNEITDITTGTKSLSGSNVIDGKGFVLPLPNSFIIKN
jgi:cell wall-associated protease